MGYFERDNELVDDQGWLHSGDIGWVDNVSNSCVMTKLK